MTIAWLFPGQGSQFVGMGLDLAERYPAAKEVFARVDAALGESLSTLIFQGHEDALALTANAQPALLTTSLAALAALGPHAPAPTFVAGHSLGEYSALAAAGVLGLEDAARLVRLRGQAMQRAVPPGAGAMAAVLGLDIQTLQGVVDEAGCFVANDNAPGQVVISGTAQAVEKATELAKARGAKRAILLPVSAPFHCPLMAPAAAEMAQVLEKTVLKAPRVPVVCNISARAEGDPGRLKSLLVEQVTGRVRWRESLSFLSASGVVQAFEIGPGAVLTGLAKRAECPIPCAPLGTAEAISNLIP